MTRHIEIDKKIAVVSSAYGGYDDLKAPTTQEIDASWVMVTDSPDNVPDTWKVVVEPRPNVPARLASRVAKCNPWQYVDEDTDIVIWMDSNIQIMSPSFIEWCINSLGNGLIAQKKQTTDLYSEIEASFRMPKWHQEPLEIQADTYIAEGYPPDYGIWWCGLSVRSKDCPKFGDLWLREMVRWTCQDQMAFSYAMWKLGIIPRNMPENLLGDSNVKFFLRFHNPDLEAGSLGVDT